MDRLTALDKDEYFQTGEISDENSEIDDESSSDEEFGQFLCKLAQDIEQRSTLEPKLAIFDAKNGDNKDDFEQDMEKELSSSFELHLSKREKSIAENKEQAALGGKKIEKKFDELNEDGTDGKGTNSDDEFYDSEQKSLKEQGKSNDDLFYDPNLDSNDQKWVDDRRKIYQQQKAKLPKSDAILNCPCCMATLCFDCQRHEIYKTQYRAMFVANCSVDDGELLFVPAADVSDKKLKKKSNLNSGISTGRPSNNELFKPVRCQKCKTQVAVYDTEEVYHFFNVLTSYT